MKIVSVAATFDESTLSNADLITIGINPCQVDATGALVVHVSTEVNGASLGTPLSGDNAPVLTITPSQLPKAVAGARFFGTMTSLDWAEKHLTNYEYWKFLDSANANRATWYVSGFLNVTTDDGYDPLDAATNGSALVSYAICQGVGGEMFF